MYRFRAGSGNLWLSTQSKRVLTFNLDERIFWHEHSNWIAFERFGPEQPVGKHVADAARAGQSGRLHFGGEPPAHALAGRGADAGAAVAEGQRSGGGRKAGAVAPAAGGVGFAQIPGLRTAARRPDPGGQHRPDEGGEALRPRPGRAPGELCAALDQGGDSRIHPEELAHGEGGDHQGAAQAVLQSALDEAGLQG